MPCEMLKVLMWLVYSSGGRACEGCSDGMDPALGSLACGLKRSGERARAYPLLGRTSSG